VLIYELFSLTDKFKEYTEIDNYIIPEELISPKKYKDDVESIITSHYQDDIDIDADSFDEYDDPSIPFRTSK
jgi:hypothetical protein